MDDQTEKPQHPDDSALKRIEAITKLVDVLRTSNGDSRRADLIKRMQDLWRRAGQEGRTAVDATSYKPQVVGTPVSEGIIEEDVIFVKRDPETGKLIVLEQGGAPLSIPRGLYDHAPNVSLETTVPGRDELRLIPLTNSFGHWSGDSRSIITLRIKASQPIPSTLRPQRELAAAKN